MKSVTSERLTFNKQPGYENYASDLRIEGDLLFEEGKFYEALESYNKSLCAARLKPQDIPLAYERRSAVYFEAQQYQLCLDNIQLARDHNCPAEKVETLDNREATCKKLIEGERVSDDDDPWTFFKLSYPPNEKIPFIVNCVELHNSPKYGRFITTTQGQQIIFVTCAKK